MAVWSSGRQALAPAGLGGDKHHRDPQAATSMATDRNCQKGTQHCKFQLSSTRIYI